MSRPQVSWIIRNNKGHIVGPLTTKEVLSRISDGTFLGDEMISAYPQGKWVSLSKEPEFYDQLLNVLEKKADDAGYKTPEKKERKVDFEETIYMPPPVQEPQPRMVKLEPAINHPKQEVSDPVIELKIQDPELPEKRQTQKDIYSYDLGGRGFFFNADFASDRKDIKSYPPSSTAAE